MSSAPALKREAVRERGILFSAPMVRALLAGTETQTRRLMKPQPVRYGTACLAWPTAERPGMKMAWADPDPDGNAFARSELRRYCPYGAPGDRLVVKESAWMWCERRPNGKTKTGRDKWHYVPLRAAPVLYCADLAMEPGTSVAHTETGNQWGWRKKIGRFLPKWASRITLEISEVRVQRLQDISEEDAKAEGVERDDFFRDGWRGYGGDCWRDSARESYASLWDSINGPGSWEASPWVWAISFRAMGPPGKVGG